MSLCLNGACMLDVFIKKWLYIFIFVCMKLLRKYIDIGNVSYVWKISRTSTNQYGDQSHMHQPARMHSSLLHSSSSSSSPVIWLSRYLLALSLVISGSACCCCTSCICCRLPSFWRWRLKISAQKVQKVKLLRWPPVKLISGHRPYSAISSLL